MRKLISVCRKKEKFRYTPQGSPYAVPVINKQGACEVDVSRWGIAHIALGVYSVFILENIIFFSTLAIIPSIILFPEFLQKLSYFLKKPKSLTTLKMLLKIYNVAPLSLQKNDVKRFYPWVLKINKLIFHEIITHDKGWR